MGLTALNNRTGLCFLFRVAGRTSYQALIVCTCFKYRDLWVQLTDQLNLIPLFGRRKHFLHKQYGGYRSVHGTAIISHRQARDEHHCTTGHLAPHTPTNRGLFNRILTSSPLQWDRPRVGIGKYFPGSRLLEQWYSSNQIPEQNIQSDNDLTVLSNGSKAVKHN